MLLFLLLLLEILINILARVNNNIDVRILESLFIYKIRPDLNDSQSAFPLNIVGR